MASSKDIREIQRKARRAGFTCAQLRGGHLAFYAPDGSLAATSSATPSDRRGIMNLLAHLRRAGLPR